VDVVDDDDDDDDDDDGKCDDFMHEDLRVVCMRGGDIDVDVHVDRMPQRLPPQALAAAAGPEEELG